MFLLFGVAAGVSDTDVRGHDDVRRARVIGRIAVVDREQRAVEDLANPDTSGGGVVFEDLYTGVTSIIGLCAWGSGVPFTNLLALISYRLADDKNGSQIAALANQELERVIHITKHMLALRRDTLSPIPLEVTEILEDVLEFLGPTLAANHVKVKRKYECSQQIEAFPGKMRQLFTCLIANAAEAGATKITLHVASYPNRKSGREDIRVVVADNGTGIQANLASQIFDPFSTTKERRGTGLGLWTVKNIVMRHRGRIRFRTTTRPGQVGTSFAVFLPQKAERIQLSAQADAATVTTSSTPL